MAIERTFVMIKPDGVKRGLIGEIISRFEKVGLKVVGLKMFKFSRELAERFYPSEEEWYRKVGEKTLGTYSEIGKDPKEDFGTDNSVEIGKIIKKWLVDFISSSPVVAMVLEGNRAIEIGRKLVGHTLPYKAMPGTIRGDFSVESPDLANIKKRAIINLVHASDSPETAEREIGLVFKEDEIYNYEALIEKVYREYEKN